MLLGIMISIHLFQKQLCYEFTHLFQMSLKQEGRCERRPILIFPLV